MRCAVRTCRLPYGGRGALWGCIWGAGLTQVVKCTLKYYVMIVAERIARGGDGAREQEFLENLRDFGGKREMYAVFSGLRVES